MNPFALITDTYERKARLYPALLVLLPVLVTVVAVWPSMLSAMNAVVGIVIACGGAFALSQLARSAGKSIEKALFARWGGMPSAVIFRHRDDRIDTITKARYHKKLSTLVEGATAPSAADEKAKPKDADRVYSAWSTYLRTKTHDTTKYALLFRENVNYGYHRNLCGLRPLGVVASVLSLLVGGVRAYQLYNQAGTVSPELVVALALALAFILLWWFRYTADAARLPADAYAERLAETVETLDG